MKNIFINQCLILILGVLFFTCTQNNESKFNQLKDPYLGQKPPGMTPEVFAPGIVSTEDHKEFGCTFSPDGKEFYFTRGSIVLHQNTIMVCRYQNGKWIAPVSAAFSGTYYDDETNSP